MLDDPVARHVLPADMSQLSLEAKQSLVAMYLVCSGRDLLGARQLPSWFDGYSVQPPFTTNRARRPYVVTGTWQKWIERT